MFKEALRNFIKEEGISQEDIAAMTGDTQQAVSDFIISDANPQKRTRLKYFKILKGFEGYYSRFKQSKSQVNEDSPSYLKKVVFNKNGVDVSIREISNFIVENEIAFFEDKIFNKFITAISAEKALEMIKDLYLKQLPNLKNP